MQNQKNVRERVSLLPVSAVLGLALAASCAACSRMPDKIDNPTWQQVRESLDDWNVLPPERGTPVRLETTEGIQGNHRLLILAFRSDTERDVFLRDFEAAACTRSIRPASQGELKSQCSSKISSKVDGARWPWLVEIERNTTKPTVTIEAWQPYD